MSYSKEDIIRMVKEEDVEFIRLQFTDIFGQLKNVAITASQIEKAVNDQVMFDGSSIEGFVRIDESDQYLYPDLDSFAIFPWRPSHGRVARLICDVHDPDLGPLDHGEGTRREICMALEQMGFEIEASHHEVAQGQHEIDFKYADALRTADNIMTFKLAVKTLAQKNGLHATFMPKPIFGINGSGMHTNMSLFQGGKNAFYDPDDPKGLSKEAYSFIAGLLAHVKGMAAVTNPLVNSYKRLVPGYEAPCYLAWSASNRSALIRIPAARGQSTRVELRSPDPACNPYLELALCLAAGLDGIEKGLTPPPEVTENIFDMNAAARKAHGIDSLPDSLEEAIHALEADPLVLDTLGEHVAANYIEGKRKEWEEYRTRVSSWEREKYIINY